MPYTPITHDILIAYAQEKKAEAQEHAAMYAAYPGTEALRSSRYEYRLWSMLLKVLQKSTDLREYK